jgi:hypothetical protein
MRPQARLLVALVAAVPLVAAACGGTSTYDVDKTRACLSKQKDVRLSTKVDFVASNALGGALSARLPGNEVTLSFALDRQEAQRIVLAYEHHKGANIGLEDVLRPKRNVVALWAAHPSDAALQTIDDCLK